MVTVPYTIPQVSTPQHVVSVPEKRHNDVTQYWWRRIGSRHPVVRVGTPFRDRGDFVLTVRQRSLLEHCYAYPGMSTRDRAKAVGLSKSAVWADIQRFIGWGLLKVLPDTLARGVQVFMAHPLWKFMRRGPEQWRAARLRQQLREVFSVGGHSDIRQGDVPAGENRLGDWWFRPRVDDGPPGVLATGVPVPTSG